VSGDGNVIKKEAEEILKYKDLHRNTACVECKNKSFTGNNRGHWNHLKIFQIIPEHHTGKAQNQSRNCRQQPYWALHTYFGKY
jgi:hypothetical protein